MRKLRTTLVALVLLAATTAFTQTELKMWTSLTYPIDVEALQRIVTTFNEQNAGIRVELVQVPGEDVTDVAKLMTAVAGGTGPDVYMLDRFTVAQRAATGLLTDISEQVQSDDPQLSENYLDYAWEEVTFQGGVYGLPFDTDVRALYYNKDMLEEAGIDPAELDRKNGPISLDRFADIARRLNETDESGAYSQVGFIPWVGQGQPYTWGFAFGGDFYDEAECRVTPTDERIVRSMAFVQEWARDLGVSEIQNYISTFSSAAGPIAWSGQIPPAQNPFITGRLGMVVEGDWFVANLERYAPDLDYGITYIPSPEGRESSWSGGWAMVVPQGTDDVDSAYRFARFIAGPEGQKIYTTDTSHLPTWRAMLEEEGVYEGERAFLKGLLPFSNSRPPLPVGGMYWGELRGAQEEAVLDRLSAQQALQRVSDRVQPRLEEYCQ